MQQLNILDEMQDNQVVEDLEELDLESNGWKKYNLGDISLEVNYGYTASASLEHVGPKFLRITDIQNNFINWENVPFCKINDKDYQKNKLYPGDICIARTGNSTGSTAIIKEDIDAVFASYLIRFRINKDIANPSYIGFLLTSNLWKDYVSSIIGGSAQPGANAKQFSNFSFILPNLKTQEKIAKILSSLDDKIELNQKMNKTLEEMAQAIFKHWFIDFEFPNEEGKPYKSSGGEMVDSELGEIPKGWRVGKLEELAYIKGGKRLPLGTNLQVLPTEHPYIRVRDMGNKYIVNSNLEYVPEDVFPKISNYIVSKGDLILSIVGTIGLVSIISSNLDKANLTENCVKIVTIDRENTSTNYLYYFLTDDLGQSQISSKTIGSTQPKLPIYNIKDINILIPDKIIQNKFELITSFLGNKTELNELNSTLIISIRDSLLPKLMSGEIRVNSSSHPEETHT